MIAQPHRLCKSPYDLAERRVLPPALTFERSHRRSRKSVRDPLHISHHRSLPWTIRPLLRLSVRKRTTRRLHQTQFRFRPSSAKNGKHQVARRATSTALLLHPNKTASNDRRLYRVNSIRKRLGLESRLKLRIQRPDQVQIPLRARSRRRSETRRELPIRLLYQRLILRIQQYCASSATASPASNPSFSQIA